MADDAPPPRVRLLRRAAPIILLLIVLGCIAVFPFVVDPWLDAQVRRALGAAGLELTERSKLSVSLLGGSITGEQVELREQGGSKVLFTCKNLSADVGVLASLKSGDLVLDELIASGMTGDLRRDPKGEIPLTPRSSTGTGAPPPVLPDGTPAPPPPEEKPVDWLSWTERAVEEWKQRSTTPPGEAPPARKPSPDHPKSQRYEPAPSSDRRLPRLVIRRLQVDGTQLGLPDDTPFDLTQFAITGTNVALRQDPGERMQLKLTGTTRGAGAAEYVVDRSDGTGSTEIRIAAVPLALLTDPRVAGDRPTTFNATGTGAIELKAGWKGWSLDAGATLAATGLRLTPRNGAGPFADSVAEAVNRLEGRPLSWPMRFGGTLDQPTVTDNGLEQLRDAALKAAQDAAIDAGTKRLQDELQKQGLPTEIPKEIPKELPKDVPSTDDLKKLNPFGGR